MLVGLIIVSVLLAVAISIIIMQLIRQEKLEEYISELESSNTEYNTFFKTLRTRISDSNSALKAVDRRGAFQSDDEVGFVFSEMRRIIDDLDRSF